MITYTSTQEKTYQIPQNWDELSLLQQQIAITQIKPFLPKLFMKENGKDTLISNDLLEQLHFLALQLLLNIKDDTFFKLDPEDVQQLIYKLKVTEFLFTQRGPLNLKNRRWKKLLGPGDKVNGITGEEIFILGKFHALIKAGKYEMTIPFLATCYRREVVPGIREDLDISTIHQREKKVKSMPLSQQLLTIAWYEANMERLAAANPAAFEGKGGGESDFVELLLQLAKDGPFGNFEKTRKAPADLLFKELNRVAKEYKKMTAKP